ncbi:MAG: SDR family NAD(P)-dependent oxidoreductase [Blastochloris sp.]|nr:SDR family NAD(P)-dependent oxidoreductase [Blastochloris sp.]
MVSKQRRTTIFLTGASTGIGRAVAVRLMSEGYEVWGTSRQVEKLRDLPGLHPLRLDFAEPESIDQAWEQALAESGGMDVVIQNAGRGHWGSVEESSVAEARRQWVDLVEGPLRLLQLAAAHMRLRRSGCILGVTSLAAELPIPFFPITARVRRP